MLCRQRVAAFRNITITSKTLTHPRVLGFLTGHLANDWEL
jgi:hypothetical protein